MPEANHIEDYLKRTHQTFEYLFSGGRQYGAKVIDEIVQEANRNNQKIVWYDDPDSPKELPWLLYRFEDI